MAAAKFDRDRGDKLTIMTASFKERRDQRSAEQIMLKNIAEKIDLLEQKRITESTSWKEDIENYKDEITVRREEDLKLFESQLQELDKKRLDEAAEFEKRELARKDSIRNSKLETEIQALRDMLSVNESEQKAKAKELDSSRFAMLDNELQSLRKMLLQAMLQDSIEAQKQAQAKIEAELAEREKEKASRDSLIAEKIAALDAVQTELKTLEAEAVSGMDTKTIIIIAFAAVITALIVLLVLQQKKGGTQQGYPPMPPMPPYPPYPMPRRKKRRKKPVQQQKSEDSNDKTDSDPVEPEKEPQKDAVPNEVNTDPGPDEKSQGVTEKRSVSDDPNVIKSEIDDIRKSVVSMSVGQPGRTSTIVKEWLEQPAPEVPSAEESPSSEKQDEGEEESNE
tara:strand:- start:7 stop:1188 length:1182 start_codon:yes stop_codon:yes gene_type:complete